MANVFSGRQPQRLYDFMFDIFSIPRPSDHEEKIAQYVIDFAKKRGLDYYTDSWHNVLIRKAGSPGMEALPPILLEGHMDIVPIKEPESDHDFLTDPIDLIVEGDWVHGNKTTLGADNGCAVAIMLAVLDDNSLVHPPLECIFTVREELGMLGMMDFDLDQIKSRRVIGMDAGAEGIFRKGVSSKYKNKFSIPLQREEYAGKVYELNISGLCGGHAQMAFPLDRACAIKLMGRVLYKLLEKYDIRINLIDKSVNRGVAEDCRAQITVSEGKADSVAEFLMAEQALLLDEYAESEPGLRISFNPAVKAEFAPMTAASSRNAATALYLMPFGSIRRVIERSEELRCYITTKYVNTSESELTVDTTVSTDKRVNGIALQSEAVAFFKLFGAKVVNNEFEFGWDPEENSPIRETMRRSYVELFGCDPIINVSHGGNDCMVLKEKIPEFDVVTTAATYLDYHTTSERLDMVSFEKVYALICRTLKNLCE